MTDDRLNKDLDRMLTPLDEALDARARKFAAPGLALLFLVAVVLFANAVVQDDIPLRFFVIAAGVIGGYMALNIGANDVANNMGPAVGGRALTMTAALIIAAICEAAGAVLAGGDVVSTISKGIIAPPQADNTLDFVLMMMAALLSAAMWIHLATFFNAPVSTTHSIVGGVLGAGVTAAGFQIVNWGTMSAIAASWVVSPVLGGVIAASMLGLIKWTVLFREDRVEAARRWVPFFIAIMVGVFAAYMSQKGFKRIWHPSGATVAAVSVASFFAAWAISIPWIRMRARQIENKRKQVTSLFDLPLILSAGLLSFAHGANDVANAVGPLAAIVSVATPGALGGVATEVGIPFWVLLIGSTGIAAGLALFGPRLIQTVGKKITRMDMVRAYCVALAAGITVLIASALGLPVSSTHIAIGGIFGVGFLREFLINRNIKRSTVIGNKEPKPANWPGNGQENHPHGHGARVLRGACGRHYRAHRLRARPAGELHAYRNRRDFRCRLLARVSDQPQHQALDGHRQQGAETGELAR